VPYENRQVCATPGGVHWAHTRKHMPTSREAADWLNGRTLLIASAPGDTTSVRRSGWRAMLQC